VNGIEAQGIVKTFPISGDVIKETELFIPDGEFVSLTGRSGSGKSTLLYMLSGLDSPTRGRVLYSGMDLSQMSDTEVHLFRNRNIGFVFQFHHLLPELNAIENVLLPARKTGVENEKAEKAKKMLTDFGLAARLSSYPGQMSGGEQQRVAIARALIMDPHYLFADEPTGNLDTKNGDIVMDIFETINHKFKTTIVMVTHELHYAKIAKRSIILQDGRIIKDERNDRRSKRTKPSKLSTPM
jgi:putative ABC transport system ATP-binding protein/lipoprotein-releasing system ATP-binding protein